MNIRKLLPLEDYTISTKLPVDKVTERIRENIMSTNNGKIINSSETYTGSISGNSFNIKRTINHTNSFLPIIKGTIFNHNGETEVRVSMRPEAFVTTLMLLFMGILGIAFIVQLFLFLKASQAKSIFSLLNTLVGLIFCWGLSYFAFKKESTISKRFLVRILEGIQVNS